MNAPVELQLNQGQQETADGFFKFLLSSDTELIISGPGGVGKSFLISRLIDKVIPSYRSTCQLMDIEPIYDAVFITATTNKAAEVLSENIGRPTQTIHSLLSLKVHTNFTTGKTSLKRTHGFQIIEKSVIFIDEVSTMDTDLLNILRESTHKCKLVFVGDHCQLAPVLETKPPVFKSPKPFFTLTEQMRNNTQPALMALCQQWRDTVETGVFKPFHVVPGVIDHLDDKQMPVELYNHLLDPDHNNRILCYTNDRVVQYNNHIRHIRNLPFEFQIGERLINANAVKLSHRMLSVEEELRITSQSALIDEIRVTDEVSLKVRETNFLSSIGDVLTGIPIPVNREHFSDVLAYFKRQKNWASYYTFKEKFPELRQRDGSTVHKAQGSTYDIVFIDLGNIATCHQAEQVARMMYVAVSRARFRIFLYGQLPEKYGGVIL